MAATRKIVVFSTPEERAVGAISQPSPLPISYILFFPRIEENAVMHTRGMTERINVFFLDSALNVISFKTMDPGESLLVPRNARHVVELSVAAKPPKDFAFLRDYVV
jgi:uncharacterized membrane protein (UPF0127 family)